MDTAEIIDLLLRGVAIGAQLGLGVALARSADNRSLRIATLLFITSNLGFLINGSAPIAALTGSVQPALWLIQIGGAGYFWLFAVTLFEDRPLGAARLAPAALLTVVGIAAQYGPTALPAEWLWGAHNLAGLLLALHALVVIVRSGANDLVEARRRLRVPFLCLIAGYSMLLSAVQIGQAMGIDAGWYELVNAAVQALLGLGGVGVLLEARAHLFGSAAPAPAPAFGGAGAGAPDTDAVWLARLEAAMGAAAMWRREGLTIAELAANVGLPEHRLRRLINDRLGHRNFAAFVNQYRIEAARDLLADPDQATRTVASIAFDLGFGSLGPFNRAFRDAAGITPTEFRRAAYTGALPIPEKPR